MKDAYNIWDIRSLLFVFDMENTSDVAREEIIVSKDVNDEQELAELFDILMRPEFLIYSENERQLLIGTLVYFLGINDDFDGVFSKIDTYFYEDVKDQRQFMRVLLECLMRYQSQATQEK
ncbi:hypothetical protein [Pseudomonas sp. H3(2019)]|uniref:hypothetical protein n=1 Tax=Pseudomonas sp. H3(2019) TaxID=2598724 RepID=UPI001195DC4D|nr:hypothetical protein [Pseudomonas sp. H3(2019)]TVT81546.1 hypothetical protein FPT12_19000 [Pseudomonas sp. H3(2019)]